MHAYGLELKRMRGAEKSTKRMNNFVKSIQFLSGFFYPECRDGILLEKEVLREMYLIFCCTARRLQELIFGQILRQQYLS